MKKKQWQNVLLTAIPKNFSADFGNIIFVFLRRSREGLYTQLDPVSDARNVCRATRTKPGQLISNKNIYEKS